MVAIDSMKIRFKIQDVKVINQELLVHWGMVSEHGEEDEFTDFKKRRYVVQTFGITTSYLIQKRKVNGEGQVESLIILVNSKLLKHNYFQGITHGTIKQLYEELMAQSVVYIGYEVFLEGALTDCDIKKDFEVKDREAQQHIVESLRTLTKPRKTKRHGYDSTITEKNLGIQWSKRDVATFSCSHVKAYAKDVELEHNSFIFKDEYLNGIHVPPTMRLECTIKNKGHFQYLLKTNNDFQQFNLKDLLSLSEVEKSDLLSRMFMQHLEHTNVKTAQDVKGLKMSEVLAICLIDAVQSLAMAKIKVTNVAKDKHQAYNARKILEIVWDSHIEQSVKDSSEGTDQILNYLYKSQDGK